MSLEIGDQRRAEVAPSLLARVHRHIAAEEIKRLLTMGATRARPTEVRPKYIVGFVKDPDGVWLELYKARK